MEIIFKNRHILELYEKGKSKKFRFGRKVLELFFMRIQELEAASDIYDLWNKPSLNFEKLEGHRNRYSIRIDRDYRLEFETQWKNRKKSRGIVIIKDISKHYGK